MLAQLARAEAHHQHGQAIDRNAAGHQQASHRIR